MNEGEILAYLAPQYDDLCFWGSGASARTVLKGEHLKETQELFGGNIQVNEYGADEGKPELVLLNWVALRLTIKLLEREDFRRNVPKVWWAIEQVEGPIGDDIAKFNKLKSKYNIK